MKARLPQMYRKESNKSINREFSRKLIHHVCKGFIVVMYKKYGWRKKRCYDLLQEVIDYLNNHYDESEAESILDELDLKLLSNVKEDS